MFAHNPAGKSDAKPGVYIHKWLVGQHRRTEAESGVVYHCLAHEVATCTLCVGISDDDSYCEFAAESEGGKFRKRSSRSEA